MEAGFLGVGPATNQTTQLFSSPHLAGLVEVTHTQGLSSRGGQAAY